MNYFGVNHKSNYSWSLLKHLKTVFGYIFLSDSLKGNINTDSPVWKGTVCGDLSSPSVHIWIQSILLIWHEYESVALQFKCYSSSFYLLPTETPMMDQIVILYICSYEHGERFSTEEKAIVEVSLSLMAKA